MRKFSVRPTLTLKGRTFKGLRGWSGKPLHPPLTDFPIAAYVLAAVFDVAAFVVIAALLRARRPRVPDSAAALSDGEEVAAATAGE